MPSPTGSRTFFVYSRQSRWFLRSCAIIAASAAFIASLVQISQGFGGPEEAAAQPSIVVSPPIIVLPPPEGETTPPEERGEIEATAPISGSWTLRTLTERTTYGPFQGLRSEYRVNLIEARNGDVSGVGELWSQNEEEVTGLNHLIMQLDGHFDGATLRLTYTLAGRERPSTGALYFVFDDERGIWTGTFDTSAGASSGPAAMEPR